MIRPRAISNPADWFQWGRGRPADFLLRPPTLTASKDLSKVKPRFKSVPLQIYFEIAGLASAKKWRKFQNVVGEERFKSSLLPDKIFK